MEVGSGFSLQDTVRAQVGVSPAGQGVGGPGCAGGRSMGCGSRARPSHGAPGRGSGAGGGWALQTGVWGGDGARFETTRRSGRRCACTDTHERRRANHHLAEKA